MVFVLCRPFGAGIVCVGGIVFVGLHPTLCYVAPSGLATDKKIRQLIYHSPQKTVSVSER